MDGHLLPVLLRALQLRQKPRSGGCRAAAARHGQRSAGCSGCANRAHPSCGGKPSSHTFHDPVTTGPLTATSENAASHSCACACACACAGACVCTHPGCFPRQPWRCNSPRSGGTGYSGQPPAASAAGWAAAGAPCPGPAGPADAGRHGALSDQRASLPQARPADCTLSRPCSANVPGLRHALVLLHLHVNFHPVGCRPLDALWQA